MSMKATAASGFAAPGPGSWSVDAVHFPRPVSRFQQELHPAGVLAGFMECCRKYGVLLKTLDYRPVNGFFYSSAIPAPEEEIPARFEAAAAALEGKLWRQELALWDDEVKPYSIKTHQALLAVEPATLSDPDLLEYVDACRENLKQMIAQHHRFNMAALVPVGDFIAHVSAWSDRPISEFLALMRGTAPESAGSFPELDRLAEAIREDAAASEILASDGDGREVLNRLVVMNGPVGDATTAYLALVGHRLLNSLDVGQPTAIEVPDALVAGVRLAVEGKSFSTQASPDEVERLRETVPAEHRDTFDALLEEARLVSHLRDERGFYSDVWAGGIMRRALLAAGARLAEKGLLEDPVHLTEADYAEIRALLQGTGGPRGAELAERARYRGAHGVEEAPAYVGDAPAPPPPLDGLPPHARRVMGAVGAAIASLFAQSEAESERTTVRGMGASPGRYSGTARVITGPEELDRLAPGDVLVTTSTTDSFNIVLPLVGAIVTNSGGLLSHAAIVGREYGIPSVVGARNATSLIQDGARVTVNGTTGEVHIETQ